MRFPEHNVLGMDTLSVQLTRIFNERYFNKVLNDGCLTLVKPEKWKDPFEDILLQCSVRTLQGSTISLKSLRGSLYAQSWSLLAESDAMWRIYSPDRRGIMVETKAATLCDALCKGRNPVSPCYFIGRVRYVTETELVNWLTRPDGAQRLLLDNSASKIAQSLLVKRDAFSHEQEVRLIYSEPRPDRAKHRQVHTITVDPHALFSRVILDPRLTPLEVKRLIASIGRRGYHGPVEQSHLYASKHFVIKLKSAWAVEGTL